MSSSEPWRIQAEESAKAYAWFQRYLDLGTARSLRKLQRTYNKPVSYVRQLATWSRKHAWVTRSAAWDAALHDEPAAPDDHDEHYLPAREDLATVDDFHHARNNHAKRLRDLYAARGACLVEVTYQDEPAYTEKLAALHHDARHRGKTPLLLIEHRPRGESVEWLAMTILPAHDAPQAHSHVDFLSTYLVQQVRSRRPPDARWESHRRRARSQNKTPLLITCKHGSRSGTLLAPLTWFLKPSQLEASP